jgi:hypothetical protein
MTSVPVTGGSVLAHRQEDADREEPIRWLGRFIPQGIIRRGNGFHLHACRDEDGSPCVVIVGAPRADTVLAQKALARLAEAHRLIVHPTIPRVRQCETTEDGTAYLVLDCDAIMDMETALGSGLVNKVEYGHAIAFIFFIANALAAAHAVIDPTTGRPFCKGMLAPANVLVGPSGNLWLIGFGHDVTTTDEHGRLAADLHGVFLAPEVAAGGDPTPSSDVFTLSTFLRAFIGFTKLPDALLQAFNGIDSAPEVMALVQAENEQILAAAPHARLASVQEQVRLYTLLWEQLGVASDPEGMAASFVAVQRAGPSHPSAALALTVALDAAWFVPPMLPGARVPPRLRGLLQCLVLKRETSQGAFVDIGSLTEAGWPGERILPEAAKNRVLVGISNLRKLGLEGILERTEAGYRLNPRIELWRVDA